MKEKIIILLIFSLGFLNISFSQSGWYQLNSPVNSNITSVFFINQDTGFIGLGGGNVYKTFNGGSNWTNIKINTSNSVGHFCFINSSTGFASTYLELFKTTNGGLNWFNIYVPTASHLRQIFFLNESIGYLANSRNVLRTTNGGLTWDSSQVEQSNFVVEVNTVYFLTPSTGLAGGALDIPHMHQLRIWRTTNSGNSWIIVYNVPGAEFTDIDFINNTGYAVGGSSYMAKSFNGGINWSALNFEGGYTNFFSVVPISETRIFSCGAYGLWISVNGGTNWSNVQIPGVAYFSMYFPVSIVGYLVGQYGYIFKTTNGGLPIGYNENKNQIPLSFSLSQNYPNPFNPVTRIKYDVPANVKGQTSNVKLIVYDILGREIETLVNQTQKPGSYEVSWDGSRYASGVYFYKLVTEEFVETRKMVLIK